MSRRQFFLTVLIASFFGAMVSLIIISNYQPQEIHYKPESSGDGLSISEKQDIKLAAEKPSTVKYDVPEMLNFENAADKVLEGVVHIRSVYGGGLSDLITTSPYNRSISSGSGVIITTDGYIATNNHVIEDAADITVTLYDNRSYPAKVVGVDESTDLALIKIDENGLSFIPFGNSDELKIGEWVLAVGNPFRLNSTVTAGIISAKARNIGILAQQNGLAIESFIQTDAAVNPGNSGGALVNLQGELVGVNTAIATQTGSYEGYSFAVPVSLVRKVMDDLLEFGSVQRGLLGVSIRDVDSNLARREGLNVVSGVYVNSVNNNSAAAEAGIEGGDVITQIDKVDVKNSSELQELVARHRPGDVIKVTYLRQDKMVEVKAKLRNMAGDTQLEYRPTSSEIDGAHFEDISESEQALLGIRGGARLKKIDEGKWKDSGIREGFVITSVDKIKVEDAEDLKNILENKSGGILIEGINKDGEPELFALKW